MSNDLDISKSLLMALVTSLCEKARGMDSQGLSNSLLACVQLKGVAPEVLTALPKLAAQISMKAKDMIPQHLSNSLWASAHLKDDADHADVAKLATALVRQIPAKAKDMIPQHLSNTLWAAAKLKDVAPDVKGDSASHRGPDPRQGQWHGSPSTLQLFVGCSSIKGGRTRREGDSASHCDPNQR